MTIITGTDRRVSNMVFYAQSTIGAVSGLTQKKAGKPVMMGQLCNDDQMAHSATEHDPLILTFFRVQRKQTTSTPPL